MDWDVGFHGKDTAQFDPVDSIMYTARSESGYPVTGMKLISALPTGSSLNYYAMCDSSNTDFPTIVQTWSFYENVKARWYTLTHSKPRTYRNSFHANDVAVTLGARDMTFTDGSATLRYVIAVGETEADVRASIDHAQSIVEGRAEVGRTRSENSDGLSIWPNPSWGMVQVSTGAAEAGPTRIRIFDALGRTVLTTVCNGRASLDLSPLAAGVYTVLANDGARQYRQTIVRQ
jgi:hypothetical protein